MSAKALAPATLSLKTDGGPVQEPDNIFGHALREATEGFEISRNHPAHTGQSHDEILPVESTRHLFGRKHIEICRQIGAMYCDPSSFMCDITGLRGPERSCSHRSKA
jgi:hypothetical protein